MMLLEKKILRGYCVKYALTTGIYEVAGEVEYKGRNGKRYVVVGLSLYRIGRDFFELKEEAEEEARKMATNEIRSVSKRLETLKELEKTPKWASREGSEEV